MDDQSSHDRAQSRIKHATTIAEELADSSHRTTFDAAHFVTRVSGCEMHLSEARDYTIHLGTLEAMRGTREALETLTRELRAKFADELERALIEREARGARSVAETVPPIRPTADEIAGRLDDAVKERLARKRAKKPPALRELDAPCMECGEPLRGASGTTCNACKDLGVHQ